VKTTWYVSGYPDTWPRIAQIDTWIWGLSQIDIWVVLADQIPRYIWVSCIWRPTLSDSWSFSVQESDNQLVSGWQQRLLIKLQRCFLSRTIICCTTNYNVTARTKCKSNPLCRLQLFEDSKLKREGKSNSIYTICPFALSASPDNCSCQGSLARPVSNGAKQLGLIQRIHWLYSKFLNEWSWTYGPYLCLAILMVSG
jgi:hypothetical protein